MKTAILTLAAVLLAGCTSPYQTARENAAAAGDDYARYQIAREVALTSRAPAPSIIPLARPFKAPTASEIAGPGPVEIARRVVRVRPLRKDSGGYYDPATGRRVTVASPARVAGAVPAVTVSTDRADVLETYAKTQLHAPGTAVYPRNGASSVGAAARACARLPGPEAAQMMFIAKGGPSRDPAGLDPDGDGFVCNWDPAPYRSGPL